MDSYQDDDLSVKFKFFQNKTDNYNEEVALNYLTLAEWNEEVALLTRKQYSFILTITIRSQVLNLLRKSHKGR